MDVTVKTHDDVEMMEQALALAQRAAGRTSPNPMVGAVVVRDARVVGQGFHSGVGQPHAEVMALREAGEQAHGATMYVTLEPCSHIGRTGPCTETIIAAGVRRVVAAMVDPDPQVNGRGITRLRQAGVEVEVGVLEAQAQRVNEFFVKHRRTGLPFVTVKWAMSVDGKIAAQRGSATAITGAAALRYAHELRGLHDAVLVGVGTVLADDPQLTCRLSTNRTPPPRNPLRVVVDSRLRTPHGARVVAGTSEARTLIVTTAAAPADCVADFRRAGVEVLVQERREGLVDLRGLMGDLGRRGILGVLVEGGGTVNAAVLEAGLADKVIAIVAPRLIGGAAAPTPLDGAGLGGIWRLRDVRVHALGEDTAIEGYVEA